MRLLIIGTSGSGKTTLAKAFAQKYALPHLELDSIYWKSGWQPVDQQVFFDRLTAFASQDHWVIEGDYDLGRDLLFSKAEVILWLDLPPLLMFYRLIKRSLARLCRNEALWQDNRETWGGIFFGKESLVKWFFKSYQRALRLYPGLLDAASQQGVKSVRIRTLAEYQGLLESERGLTELGLSIL